MARTTSDYSKAFTRECRETGYMPGPRAMTFFIPAMLDWNSPDSRLLSLGSGLPDLVRGVPLSSSHGGRLPSSIHVGVEPWPASGWSDA